jgi:hypothetical protein
MIATPRIESPTTAYDPIAARPLTLINTLNWSAIIGGTVLAMGVHILLSALGVGASLGTFSPTSDTNPVVNFSIGSAIV